MVHSRKARRPGGGRLRAGGVLAAVVLGLTSASGCGTSLNLGAAATINGTPVSKDAVDSIVKAACAFTAASAAAGAQPGPPTSLANLRSSITQTLIQFQVTDEAASEMGLSVSQAAISSAAAQNAAQTAIPSSLDDADADALNGFFYDFAKSTTQVQLIGSHLADPSITTFDQVTVDKSAEARQYLNAFVAKQDVTVNPAYGRWTGSSVAGGSGSLSDPVSAIAKASQAAASDSQANTSDLPASQVC